MTHIDDYIAARPDGIREIIAAAYAVARELAPGGEQALKYGMPCLALDGKGVISVMQTQKHIGVYPFSSAVVASVGALPGLIGTTKGALHFSLQAPLPDETVRAIVTARLAEIAG